MMKNPQIAIKNASQYESSEALLTANGKPWKTNLLIGYCGPNEQLRTWANQQARRLELRKYAIPERVGGDIQQTRRLLWHELQNNRIDHYLEPLLQSLRAGNSITLWFLNYRDVEMARLIRRYLEYCFESGLFDRGESC
ncbi:MAG: hypothetical protein ACRCT1_12410 [Microcoleaceae cyanobacterium]